MHACMHTIPHRTIRYVALSYVELHCSTYIHRCIQTDTYVKSINLSHIQYIYSIYIISYNIISFHDYQNGWTIPQPNPDCALRFGLSNQKWFPVWLAAGCRSFEGNFCSFLHGSSGGYLIYLPGILLIIHHQKHPEMIRLISVFLSAV